MRTVRVPGGDVTLTDARRDSARTVTLRGFELCTTTVTADEFAAGRAFTETSTEGLLPAMGVSWREAVEWCIVASQHAGLRPAYAISAEGVTWNPAADGYRLPTEAEWVHGSRGGTGGPRYGALDAIAWSAADHVSGPQPSGLKQPNAFGLFDTLGNVWEWCWDRLDPARYGDYRVLKGGGWADPAWSCRVGVRRGNAPDARVEDVGFRVARGAVAAPGAGAAGGAGPGVGPGGAPDGGQGWSEAEDRRRARAVFPLPVGWTPLE